MSDSPPASAAQKPLPLWKRLRPRALVLMLALAASIFMWPGLLQFEKLPARAAQLEVLGPAAPGGGGGAPSHGARVRSARLPHLNIPAPAYGALREGPAGLPFAQMASLDPQPIADPELVKAVSYTPLAPPSGPTGGPFVPPGLTDPRPEPGDFVGGPGPTGPTSPGNPPITTPTDPGPPVVGPPVVGPPVDPGNPPVTPPVVGPPDGPPVVTPPPVTNPPPIVDPDPPFTTQPTDPGGPPPSGAPEPGIWLELIVGAGLAGMALRRARLQPATALRAVSRA